MGACGRQLSLRPRRVDLLALSRRVRRACTARQLVEQLACGAGHRCTATGRVIGTERLRVPAGTFDTIKVEIEHVWFVFSGPTTGSGSADMNGSRKLIAWYSPRLKRAVKYSSRVETGRFPPIEADFDLELVSYKLN